MRSCCRQGQCFIQSRLFRTGELQLRNGRVQKILSKALKEAKRSEDIAAYWNRGTAVLETLCHGHNVVKLTAKPEANVS